MTIAKFIHRLDGARIEASEREVAEVLWLAHHVNGASRAVLAEGDVGSGGLAGPTDGDVALASAEDTDGDGQAELHVPGTSQTADTEARRAVPVRAPAAAALPGGLDILRALRPLKRSAPAAHDQVLDEEATADRIADEGLWVPVLRPAAERWLTLAIVVDAVPSMVIWRSLIGELGQLAAQFGAFRAVRTWYLHATPEGAIRIHPREQPDSPLRDPRELTDPSGRQAVLLISDCVDARWRDGRLDDFLHRCGRAGPLAIGQPLPQRLWGRSAVTPVPARLRAAEPGRPNATLLVAPQDDLSPVPDARARMPVPMLELGPDWLGPWARLVAGTAYGGIDAVLAGPAIPDGPVPSPGPGAAPEAGLATARQLVAGFRAVASPDAYRLMCYLSVVPLTLPVMRIVQTVMLPRSRPSQLAEVFLSGLLRAGPAEADPELRQYEFADGVRDTLLGAIRRSEALRVFDEVSAYIIRHPGQVREMTALVAAPLGDQVLDATSVAFAAVPASVARRLGLEPGPRPAQAPAGGPAPGSPAEPPAAPISDRATSSLQALPQPTGIVTVDIQRTPSVRDCGLLVTYTEGGRTVFWARDELPLEAVRQVVTELLTSRAPGDSTWVEFALPAEFADLDVDQWQSATSRSTIGARFPVVVRGGEEADSRTRNNVSPRWDRLREDMSIPGPNVLILDAPGQLDSLRYDLRGRKGPACLIVDNEASAGYNDRFLFDTVREAGIPVALWWRGDTATARLGGRLRREVAGRSVAELPEIVTRLRREAATDQSADHIGKYLTLYWDDPSWGTQGTGPTPPYLEVSEREAAETPAPAATGPLFFLSYAREPGASGERLVTRFFDDLTEDVAQLVASAPGASISFRDDSIRGGMPWREELLDALGTCQVFIPLISVAYVTSQWCAMEWDAFSRRTVTSAPSAPRGSPIVPVIWGPITASQIPEPIQRYQWFQATTTDTESYGYGLSGLLQTKQEDTYRRLVWQLARRIAELSRTYHVEEQTMRWDELRNIFRQE